MTSTKRECAIATAGVTLGGILHEAIGFKEEYGTLIRIMEHPESHSATEICVLIDHGKITGLTLRDHDEHMRYENFDGIMEMTLRLAECILHGAGALRRLS